MTLAPVKVVPLTSGVLIAVCNKADLFVTSEGKNAKSGYLCQVDQDVYLDNNPDVKFNVRGFIEYTQNEVLHNVKEGLVKYLTGESGNFINFLYDKEALLTSEKITEGINRSVYFSIKHLLKESEEFKSSSFDNTTGTHGSLTHKHASFLDRVKNIPELELSDSLLSLSIYTGLQPGKIGVLIKEASTLTNRI